MFGLEEVESPEFGEFKVVWLRLPSSNSSVCLHLIERDPTNNLPEGPWSATSPVADPKHLPRGHHLCFSVPDFHSFLHTLKVQINLFNKQTFYMISLLCYTFFFICLLWSKEVRSEMSVHLKMNSLPGLTLHLSRQ